jgi:hypothetical protein
MFTTLMWMRKTCAKAEPVKEACVNANGPTNGNLSARLSLFAVEYAEKPGGHPIERTGLVS